jgi:predicted dehydrogenase
MILKNKLGKPIFVEINCSSYLPNWRPNKNYRKSVSARSDLGGGVLLELSHELDYLNWIFGPFSKINSKLNISGKLDIDVEDEAYLNLISKNKLPISVYLNFYKKENKRNCKFITSKGTLEWNGIKNCVTYHNHKGKIKKWNFKIKKDYMYENQLNHFLKCIEKKISPQVSLTSGIEALKLVVRAKESSLKKSIINI